MAGSNRPVTIRLAGDTKRFDKAMKGAKSSMKGLGKVGKTAGLAMAAGLGAGIAGIVSLGSKFEEVERILRVGTGATGDQLKALEDITKRIATTVPADFLSIGNAVADINTRLGLTGPELEAFSVQMLNLARITGSDVQSNIASVTRVLGDWGDQAGTAADSANYLFTVSQMTGIEVGRLSDKLVEYGAPLRQVGFSFQESALLIGKFEKEGVNAELVLGSLRQALGMMAREGEPAIETFRRTVEAIENAGDASEANRIALELFGARAGPDMAAAIREGRFELDDYFAAIEGGVDNINSAAKETETLREKMTLLKNRVIVALAPIVEKVFDRMVLAFESLQPVIENLVEHIKGFLDSEDWLNFAADVAAAWETLKVFVRNLSEEIKRFADENPETVFAMLATVIGVVLVGAIALVVTALAGIFTGVSGVVIAIMAIAGVVVYAYNQFDLVSGYLDTVWENILEWKNLIVGLFEGDWEPIWESAVGIVSTWMDAMALMFLELPTRLVIAVGPLLGDMVNWAQDVGVATMAAFNRWLDDDVIPFFSGLASGIGVAILNTSTAIWDTGVSIGTLLWNGMKSVFSDFGSLSGDLLVALWDFGKDIGKMIINGLIFVWNLADLKVPRVDVPDWIPGFGGKGFGGFDLLPDVQYLKAGGIVSGPMLAMLGDNASGREAVVPLPSTGLGNTYQVTINMPAGTDGDDVVRALRRWQSTNGPIPVATR